MDDEKSAQRGPGRPAADPERPCNQTLYIRLSGLDLELLDVARGDMSRSAWALEAIRQRLRRHPSR